MKRYLIISDDASIKPVSADALELAKSLALLMLEDVEENTPVYIFSRHTQVVKSVLWDNKIHKNKVSKVSKTKADKPTPTPAKEPELKEKRKSGRAHIRGYHRSGKAWSALDDTMLVRMLEAKKPMSEISKSLQRTANGIYIRIARMRRNSKKEAELHSLGKVSQAENRNLDYAKVPQ